MSATIALDTQAGEVSAELVRRGLTPETPVHVVVQVHEPDLPMARIAQAGGAFDWLHDEPELYSDADILPPRA
jgi:hypothetical protein